MVAYLGEMGEEQSAAVAPVDRVPLRTIAREWTRLGCIGFGGPPTHISLLRRLCVEEHDWLGADEFEDGIAATNLLPGPASTQLAIFCAWRLRGAAGAVLGGLCFILPGLVLILGMSAVFLASHPPTPVLGAAAGAGAAVPAVALVAAWGLAPPSWRRVRRRRAARARWIAYGCTGAAAAATVGQLLVLVLLACGAIEVVARSTSTRRASARGVLPAMAVHSGAMGGLAALTFVAIKVGALSYGGGFVIVPLMQHDAVVTYHWMSGAQFLNAVALGQVTPGPVVQTVAVVGYAAAGIAGGLLAAAVAFAPSFVFVLAGGPRFDRIRRNTAVQSFFAGAGPAVIGAIAGSALPLGLELGHLWQLAVLAAAMLWLFVLRRGVVSALCVMGSIGIVAGAVGAPVR
jgi:chromate transporter